jgi:hypothetical protein
VGAPILAAALLKPLGLGGIFALDLLGASAAVLSLLLVPIPNPRLEAREKTSWIGEALFGFRFILERPPLLGLQLMFFGINFLTTPRSLYESFLSYVGVTFPLLPWGQPVRG